MPVHHDSQHPQDTKQSRPSREEPYQGHGDDEDVLLTSEDRTNQEDGEPAFPTRTTMDASEPLTTSDFFGRGSSRISSLGEPRDIAVHIPVSVRYRPSCAYSPSPSTGNLTVLPPAFDLFGSCDVGVPGRAGLIDILESAIAVATSIEEEDRQTSASMSVSSTSSPASRVCRLSDSNGRRYHGAE